MAKLSKNYNLLFLYPEIAKQWHPTKNGDLRPEDFTPGSEKKIWWICPKDNDHIWVTQIISRTTGSGCSYCSGKKASKKNNLKSVFPKIADLWHPTKNSDLKPENFTSQSEEKVWWKCPKGDDHVWMKPIKAISKRIDNLPCPYCDGKKSSKARNLLKMFPKLCKEWHPFKNGKKKPENFTPGSKQKVWWRCKNNHEWDAVIYSRTNPSRPRGGSKCSNQTSQSEIRIYTELYKLLKKFDVKWRFKFKEEMKIELDVYISNLKLGIEYDGFYFHKNSSVFEEKKNKYLISKNINLIRIREYPLKKTSNNDIISKEKIIAKETLNLLLFKIHELYPDINKRNIYSYTAKNNFINESEFNRIISYLPYPTPEKSLLRELPIISKIWNYKKNFPLKPENFTYGSEKIVWWKCSKIDNHIWPSGIKGIVRSIKEKLIIADKNKQKIKMPCPLCLGRPTKNYNLTKTHPDLCRYWCLKNNLKLKPENYTSRSKQKVWWRCKNNHEWSEYIYKSVKKIENNQELCHLCEN
jgi:hypothetical protein